jgi:hypothetical protein
MEAEGIARGGAERRSRAAQVAAREAIDQEA